MLFSWYVIAYLFLAGVASGIFVVSAACCIWDSLALSAQSARAAAAVQPGFLMAPVIMLAAVLFLFFDLGNPDAIWRLILNPLGSIMSVGAWLLLLLLVVSLLLTFSAMGRSHTPSFQGSCMVIGAVLALGVMTYTGLLLQSLVTVEFWQTPWLPVLFVASSLSTGTAALILADAILHGAPVGTSIVPWRLAGVFCAVEILALIGFMTSRQVAGGLAYESASLLSAGTLAPEFWLLVVFAGLVAPAVLHMLGSRVPLRFARVTSSLGVLAGGLALRYCVVAAALLSPVTMTVIQIV